MDFIHNVPIKVPNKSGFDLSHEHIFSGVCGELAPVLVHELLPNDSISLGASFQVQLPPSVTDFYGRINFHLEAFFVPNRLCWAGWKDFITHPTLSPQYPEGTRPIAKPSRLPGYYIYSGDSSADYRSFLTRGFGAGTLSDYLGFKIDPSSYPQSVDFDNLVFYCRNILPYVAYHRIYDDWFRDSRIQAPLFVPSAGLIQGPDSSSANAMRQFSVSNMPFVAGDLFYDDDVYSVSSDIVQEIAPISSDNPTVRVSNIRNALGDGEPFTNIRLRNWSKDLFTSASPYPQASVVGGKVELPVVDGETSISIAAIRSANSLQQWLERNNLAGYRYSDQIYAQFGRYPSDAIMDRPIYLGRIKQPIYTRSVFQQSNSEGIVTSNPFKTVGAKYGNPQAVGDGSLIDSFTASEHGFLIVLASLVPHAYYGSGVARYLKRSVVGDFAFPLLANMGDQAIRKSELSGDWADYLNDSEFGYTDMYAEYKVINDHVSGYLRDGYNLESFVMQRTFGSDVELGSDFLQIPRTYLDQISTVEVTDTRSSYWADVYFVFKKSSTLPVYSQPTLMDLQNGHIETISRGGTRL